MKNILLSFLLLGFCFQALGAGETKFKDTIFTGSVAIGSTTAAANAKALLDITSTTKVMLPPRMTTTQRDAITSPPEGSFIYNTTTHRYDFYNGSAWKDYFPADLADNSGALSTASQITSTVTTGTAPFVIASTTQVANLNAATAGSATTATTATNATNTGITDDTTTNATMYLTWVTANTGNLPQKVSSTKATFNPSTSTITATTFAGNSTTSTKPAAGSAHGVVVLDSSGNFTTVAPSTANKVLTSDGTDWTSAAGGGGGGGGITVKWLKTGGNSPTNSVYSSDEVELFDAGLAQELYATFKLPTTYTAGSPVKIKLVYSSPDTSGTVLFTAVSTLLVKDTTAFTSTTNQRTTTNTAATLSGAANRINEVILDVSDSTGNINSVALAAGAVLKIKLTRGTDTATSQARLHINDYEVTVQ